MEMVINKPCSFSPFIQITFSIKKSVTQILGVVTFATKTCGKNWGKQNETPQVYSRNDSVENMTALSVHL